MTKSQKRKWQTIETAPEGIVVETKRDGPNGTDLVTKLTKYDGLWFLANTRMYVYYTPTHWRPL